MTRFAPAPTGLLHLGHVVNAIYVWGLGHARGADVILRIEDHDRQRSRPEYEARLLDELDWLGFTPDHYPTDAFRRGLCASRQSDRDAIYWATVRQLSARGLVYGCQCSRRTSAPSSTGGRACSGACRHANLGLADGITWRLRVDVTDGRTPFRELLMPSAEIHHGPLDDPAIRDRHGNWTYQFAVVVDDHDQQVDLVIRGRDLASSTSLQVEVGRIIGRQTPAVFAHHPLVMKSATEKLSKSDGDSGVGDLRESGWTAERVIGRAASIAGLVDREQPLSADEVPMLFTDYA